MTASRPVSSVIKYLQQYGYRLLPAPLMVSGMTFNFPAVLVGPKNSSDLILVSDTAETQENSFIVRQVLAVGRALDIAQMSNPLTVIVVGPQPSQSMIFEMMSVGRVLPVGTLPADAADQILANWLAVLTPIASKKAAILVDPVMELEEAISTLREDVIGIVKYAAGGSDDIKEAINDLLKAELEKALDDRA